MARETGDHRGEGRGWRGAILTTPRRKMLRKMKDGQEWDALSLSAASGVAYATVYQSLKSFEEAGWATSRLESVSQHQARAKRDDQRNKGPRLTYWKLTEAGMYEARQA